MAVAFFYLLSLLPFTLGANDWGKPCTSGVCFYDLPATRQGPSGTMKIWGSNTAITDITKAAGWEILNCDGAALHQDIRLVCVDETKCGHLYDQIGAEGKIVRLPEWCGATPFAHVSRAWTSEDQTVPENIPRPTHHRNHKNGHDLREVKALHIDTDFAKVDHAKVGEVSFAVAAANVPGAKDQLPTDISRLADARLEDDIDFSEILELPPFKITASTNLVDESLTCGPLENTLTVDVGMEAEAIIALAVAIKGKILPPDVEFFRVAAAMSANINGNIDIKAGIKGEMDTEDINIFEFGVPGLSIPGIVSIGPSFAVDARATATLDIAAELNVGVNYKVNNLMFVFPPDDNDPDQGPAFSVGDTPIKLSAAPSVKATGEVAAHVIPSLNLGVDVLGGIAGVGVFLELDASASVKLELTAGAEAGAGNGRLAHTTHRTSHRKHPRDLLDESEEEISAAEIEDRSFHGGPGRPSHHKTSHTTHKNDNLSTNFGGCFEVGAALDVNIGADAEFFGLFDAETSKTLFNKQFEIFKKCFGEQPPADPPAAKSRNRHHPLGIKSRPRRSLQSRSTTPLSLVKRDFQCGTGGNDDPNAPPAALVPVVDETVAGANVVSPAPPSA